MLLPSGATTQLYAGVADAWAWSTGAAVIAALHATVRAARCCVDVGVDGAAGDGGGDEGGGGAGGDGDVEAGEAAEAERVAGGVVERLVPIDGGDGAEVEMVGGVDHRDGIIMPRVAVEQDGRHALLHHWFGGE